MSLVAISLAINSICFYNRPYMNKKLKILLVDDEIDVLNTIGLLLTSDDPNIEIIQKDNGHDAINYITDNKDELDIIISDINMDGINGAQLAKIVNGINPKIRIILMSGFISFIDQIKHFQLGIEKILTKPFEISELISIIENPVEIKECSVTSMIPVKIGTLVDTKKNPVDIFVQISDDKFIKMFHAKHDVDVKRLQQFLDQEVLFLYAKQEDGLNLELNLFVPVRLSTLKTKRNLSFSVYYLHDDDYKQLIPSGSVLNKEMLALIKDRNIKTLYISDKEQPLYLNYLDQTLDDFMQNKEVSSEDKLTTASRLMQARTKEIYLAPTNENIVSLKKSQKHFIDFLKSNSNSINDLLQINSQDKSIHIHCSVVAALSYALLLEIIKMRGDEDEKLKIRVLDEYIFESDDIKEIVFTGALLHDLGKSLLQITSFVISGDEVENEYFNVIKKHPQAAYDKLKDYDSIHPKSLEIIIQHEEFCDGTGFPNKLKKTNISFFSQVVILVNYFDNLKRNQHMSSENAILAIKKTPEKFNRHLIPILERIILKDSKSVERKRVA